MTHFEEATALFKKLGFETTLFKILGLKIDRQFEVLGGGKIIDTINNEGKLYEFEFGSDGSFTRSRNISQQEEEEMDGYYVRP